MTKNKEQGQSFESSLTSLERVVAQLESGDLPLEQALELFEEGVGLARGCQSQLEEAERKVETLLRERGEIKLAPFELPKEAQMNTSETLQGLSMANVTTAASRPLSENTLQDENGEDDSVPF